MTKKYIGMLYIFIYCMMIGPSAKATPPAGKGLVIEQVVMLMRQGVGLGGGTLDVMRRNNWAITETHFAVPDTSRSNTELSRVGRTNMMLWGHYHRRRLATLGMLSATGPLSERFTFAYASPIQRTQSSAQAFLLGFAPGSGIVASTAPTGDWFLPSSAVAQADRLIVKQAVESGLGMPLANARQHFTPVIAGLERQLAIPTGRISALPWDIQVSAGGVYIAPLWLMDRIGAVVDSLYANKIDLPDLPVDGESHRAALSALTALRRLNNDATRHPRYLAVRQSATLLNRISRPLLCGSEPSVSLFVVQAGSIAAIRGILGFDQDGNARQPTGTFSDLAPGITPGAMLMFERVRLAASNERFVRVSFHAPTMDQIRDLHVFNDMAPPVELAFRPPLTLHPVDGNLIPLARFSALVGHVFHDAGLHVPSNAEDTDVCADVSISVTPTTTPSAWPSITPLTGANRTTETVQPGHFPPREGKGTSQAIEGAFAGEDWAKHIGIGPDANSLLSPFMR